MSLKPERIQELREVMEKDGKEVSQAEVKEAARSLEGLARIFVDSYFEDQRRKKKLEEFPRGYTLDGVGYSCFICGSGTKAGENWYDKYGIKCLVCQKGIDCKEIPATLAKNKESWYTEYELKSRFNLNTKAQNAWIKNGILKARTITGPNGGTHVRLFLIKDNKDFLPPKKMTESKMVSETKEDGAVWHKSYPWYRFVDPFEYLKDYRIMEYMQETEPEKMEKSV